MSGWTREKLLTRIREVSVWKKGDQRAPHKPLLILYALGKLLEGQDELTQRRVLGGRTGNGMDHEEGRIISF